VTPTVQGWTLMKIGRIRSKSTCSVIFITQHWFNSQSYEWTLTLFFQYWIMWSSKIINDDRDRSRKSRLATRQMKGYRIHQHRKCLTPHGESESRRLPSGKRLHNYRKSPCLMGKSWKIHYFYGHVQ
jgi:hypothetical protein